MNGFLLLAPFFLIRFGLMAWLDHASLARAAHFAPMRGGERAAYLVYQLANAGILLYPLFLTVPAELSWPTAAGAALYLGGLALCSASVICLARPDARGLNRNGVYRYSRNPMYLAYFLCFAGMAVLTRSWGLLALVLVFQVCAHQVILAEERECLARFGEPYRQYMEQVRRYL